MDSEIPNALHHNTNVSSHEICKWSESLRNISNGKITECRCIIANNRTKANK